MFQAGIAYLKLAIKGRIYSVKILSLIVFAVLVAGNVTATYSDDEVKVPGFWAAAKDFWNFLKAPNEPDEQAVTDKDAQEKDKQLVEIISDELGTSDDAEEFGLFELANNPICKAIYVAEYLPTYNPQAIQKCQDLIKQEEFKSLFEHYVAELCQKTAGSKMTKDQITQIQLRLRKYSQTFPQANFQVEIQDIDGIYGSKTCEDIAFYQIASQSAIVDGKPDQLLYEQLVNRVPLSENEINDSLKNWRKGKNLSKQTRLDTTLADQGPNSFKQILPMTPLQKDVFCVRYPDDPHCNLTSSDTVLARLEFNER